MSDETMTLTVRIHDDEDGLWAEVVDLPGVFATGDDLDELWDCLEEGVSLYLSTDEKTVIVRRLPDGETTEERRRFELCSV